MDSASTERPLSCTIIRADGSARLGIGHVMRSLALAEGLQRIDLTPVFVTRSSGAGIVELIASHSFMVEVLPTDASISEDVERTLASARQHRAKLIVTDVCHQDALADRHALDAYHAALRRSHSTLCITGSSAVDIPADVVLNPYFRRKYPTASRGDGRILLLGPSYFIFRREFIDAARVPRTIAAVGRRVLVTIGGSDALKLTTKVLRAAASLAELELDVHVMIGLAYPPEVRREAEALLTAFDGRAALLDHAASMSREMLWADVAVTGDGLTKYETAVTGTPSLTLSQPGGETELSGQFESAGSTTSLGDGTLITVEAMADAIAGLLGDAARRQAMSRSGKQLVDGRGLERVLETLSSIVGR